MNKLIELNDISFGYGGRTALSHISLSVCRGETLVLTGPNGSGKSTLLKILCGLAVPDSGTWFYDGKEINARTLKNKATGLRSSVGLVFQNPEVQLFCGCVEEVIAFGLEQRGTDPETVSQRVRLAAEAMGIEALLHVAPWQLSGGEKKKTAIAAVLCDGPETMLLDEPLGGLDTQAAETTIEVLRELQKQGNTLILAAHEDWLPQRLGARLLRLNEQHCIENI